MLNATAAKRRRAIPKWASAFRDQTAGRSQLVDFASSSNPTRPLGGDLIEAERSLVRQAAALQLQAEKMQEQIVGDEAVDNDDLIRLPSTTKRLLSIIGAKTGKRKPAAGRTLHEYLASKAAAGTVVDALEADEA